MENQNFCACLYSILPGKDKGKGELKWGKVVPIPSLIFSLSYSVILWNPGKNLINICYRVISNSVVYIMNSKFVLIS